MFSDKCEEVLHFCRFALLKLKLHLVRFVVDLNTSAL